MRRVRTSLILLLVVVGALLASWLQLARDSTRLPAGSSYSYQPDGAAALYLWSESLGGARRLSSIPWPSNEPVQTLVVVQPELPVEREDQAELDDIARDGGTLVLIGDSPALQVYARDLGVTYEPMQITSTADSDAGPIAVRSRYRLRGTGTPLLTAPNGDVIALRRPYRGGTLIVVATPEVATNSGLRDEQVARFVYRTVVAPGAVLTFDEAHHTYAPVGESGGPATVDGLLFGTAPGRAVLYGAALTFVFLLLAGRRLGPPLAERGATETRRTMYEHVQMLAGLYRRAAHLAPIRTAFQRHYQRQAARSVLSPTRAALLDQAMLRMHDAHSEADLIGAVTDADRALSAR
jgi:hypothetical protein